MANVEARQRVDAFTLRSQIDRFIDDNLHSSDVALRWLSVELKTTMGLVTHIGDGKKLDPKVQAAIRDFRLKEIEAEKTNRQIEIDRLEREAFVIRSSVTA